MTTINRKAVMARLASVLTALVLCFQGVSASAESTDLPSLAAGYLFIWNGTDKDVVFHFSEDGDAFVKHSLPSDKQNVFAFSDGVEEVHYAIRTGDHVAEGKVDVQKRYRIVWVGDGGYFDFREMTN